MINDRNSKDLTEAEKIKKRWQECTEEIHTKKGLNDPDNHGGNLKKVNFHFNLKERQCQRMFQLLYNCTHFTR